MTKLLVLARAALALSVSILPLTASVDMGGFHVKTLAAFAKDGHSGSDGDGGGGSSGRGGGDSDSDSDNDGGESGGGDSDGDHDGGGNSGSGGGDSDSDNDGGDDNDSDSDDSDDDGGDDDSGHGAEHVDPSTGAKIEVSGSSIEVRYPNGVKEELENGRYEMKDSSGRTIVERVATSEDIARLTDLAN